MRPQKNRQTTLKIGVCLLASLLAKTGHDALVNGLEVCRFNYHYCQRYLYQGAVGSRK